MCKVLYSLIAPLFFNLGQRYDLDFPYEKAKT